MFMSGGLNTSSQAQLPNRIGNVKQDNVVSVSCTSCSVHALSIGENVGKANEEESAAQNHIIDIDITHVWFEVNQLPKSLSSA